MSAITLLPAAPPATPRRDRMPAYKTIGYTLSISSRFLLSGLVGNGTIARADELIDWYWRSILKAGGAGLVAEGREHFVKGAAHVVMSNHSSLLDIPSMMGAVPGSLRMVMKQELARVPVWGAALVASGFIPIDRKNRDKAIAQLKKAQEMLLKGVNVWISPEGTRSRINVLGPFKKGGFHTALALGAPIIPAWIDGAFDIIEPDQWASHYGRTITVRFGAPIPTVGRDASQLEELMAEVRAAMVALSGLPDEHPTVATLGRPARRPASA